MGAFQEQKPDKLMILSQERMIFGAGYISLQEFFIVKIIYSLDTV